MNASRIFSISFAATGVFALIGALAGWGQGWLFSLADPRLESLLLAEILVTFPLSIVAASGVWLNRKWGQKAGLMTASIYVFGSVQVWLYQVITGPPYSLHLLLPPVFGCCLSFAFVWYVCHDDHKRPNN